jgi:hypothetical protein
LHGVLEKGEDATSELFALNGQNMLATLNSTTEQNPPGVE